MLNNNTQEVLKSLLPMNNSFVVDYPSMTIVDEHKTMMGRINTEILDDEFETFGIYDGANFLSALGLLDNAEIELKDNLIVAKDDNTVMNFLTSSPSSLEDSVAKHSVFDTTLAAESVLEFEITVDTINRLKKAAGVFKTMNALSIVKSDDVYMKMATKDTFAASKNEFNVKITPDLDIAQSFDISIPLENILKLPVVDYTVKVKYNKDKDVYRVIFHNEIYTILFTLMK